MSLSRDFTASTFVVWQSAVLLHRHPKLGMWLPCGGHIEPNELPDEAAVREVFEESEVRVELVGAPTLEVDEPRQLATPRGVQLETIYPGHEHIDLIYFGRPLDPYDGTLPQNDSFSWYGREQLGELGASDEVLGWCALALAELG